LSLTFLFIIITIGVSYYALQKPAVMHKLIFNPYTIHHRKEWYRFFSSGLIHADYIHLAVNMFVLYSLGQIVEFYFSITFGERGQLYFFLLYASALAMSIIPTFNKHKDDPSYNGLGASGAVSAIVFSFIVFDPMKSLCLYGLEILCLPGIIFGVLYLVYCYYMGKKGGDNINHSAHMWGALYGFGFTILLRPSLIGDFFERLIYFRNVI
jgi:membrane associated rhomboid family serine protease